MAVSNVAQLKFETDTEETVQINVPHADTALTYPGVLNSMNAVIATNAAVTGKGRLATAVGAALVSTQTVPIDLE